MNDLNNDHPLAGDFTMYYGNTYVFFEKEGVPHVMYVEGTEEDGDDTRFDGFILLGRTYTLDDNEGRYSRVRFSDVVTDRPASGYYDIHGTGFRNVYVTFAVNNRTQKKGLDPRNFILNGIGSNGSLYPVHVLRIFLQSRDMISSPSHRDFYTEEGKRVFWKGMLVGDLVEGQLVVKDEFKKQEGLLCRLYTL